MMISLLVLFGFGFFMIVFVAVLTLTKRKTARKIPPAQNAAPLPSPFAASPRFAEQEVLALLRNGQKIQAIKRYREMTGVGLREAKDAVETLENPPHSAPTNAAINDDGEYRHLLRQGQKIEAIKLYRERTGVGLREAKDAIEAMDRRG